MLKKGTVCPPFNKLPPQGALPNFKVFCPNAREKATPVRRQSTRLSKPCSHTGPLQALSQELAALQTREATQLRKLRAESEQVQKNADLIESLKREVAAAKASQELLTEFQRNFAQCEFKKVKEPFSLVAAEPLGYCLEGP